MPLWSLISGFDQAQQASIADERARADAQRETEFNLFKALAQSPDEDIRSMAIAGLMQAVAQPKRTKGLKGFIGEMEQNPYLAAVQGVIRTPVARTKKVREPREPLQGQPLPQAQMGAAALPAASPTQGGPMATPPSFPQAFSEREVTEMVPRRVLPTEEDIQQQMYSGRVSGIIRGIEESTGQVLPPEVKERIGLEISGFSGGYGASGAGFLGEGEVFPDPTSDTGYSQPLYDKRTGQVVATIPAGPRGAGGASPFQAVEGQAGGQRMKATFDRARGVYLDPITRQPIPGFEPLARTGSAALTLRAIIAKRDYGSAFPPETDPRDILTQLGPEQLQQVLAEETKILAQQSGARARAVGNEAIATELGKPIGMEAGATSRLPATTPLGAVSGVPLTPEQSQRLTAIQGIRPQLEHIRDLITQVFPPQAGLIGGVTASASLAKKRAANDPAFARLDAAINTAASNLSRTVASERGQTTERDLERALSGLADVRGFTDTRESALARITESLSAVNRAEQAIHPPTTAPMNTPPAGKPSTAAAPNAELSSGVATLPDANPPPAKFKRGDKVWRNGREEYVWEVVPGNPPRYRTDPNPPPP